MSSLSKHILLMPDGDRRFARRHHMSHHDVYQLAANNVMTFVRLALLEFDIRTVSVYLTRPDTYIESIQKRGDRNLLGIIHAVRDLSKQLIVDSDLAKMGVRFYAIGTIDPPPSRIVAETHLLNAWREMTESFLQFRSNSLVEDASDSSSKEYRVNLLMNYSGLQSLNSLIDRLRVVHDFSSSFQTFLDAELGGPIGLVIRTGDAMRMSDAPCHLCFSSVFHHLPRLFPEVQKEEFRRCLSNFYSSKVI